MSCRTCDQSPCVCSALKHPGACDHVWRVRDVCRDMESGEPTHALVECCKCGKFDEHAYVSNGSNGVVPKADTVPSAWWEDLRERVSDDHRLSVQTMGANSGAAIAFSLVLKWMDDLDDPPIWEDEGWIYNGLDVE